MSTSPNLGIPFIATSQSQPETTHNEAVLLLQVGMTGVESLGDTTPPTSPGDGDAYVIGSGATGAWSGRDNAIAVYHGGWRFLPYLDDDGDAITIGADHEGLSVWVKDEDKRYRWSGTAWIDDLASRTLTDPTLSGTVKVDVISEKTTNAGVTADGVVMKDGGVTATAASAFGATVGVTGLLTATAGIRAPVGTNTYYGCVPSTAHLAANAGSVGIGIVDGGGVSAVKIVNTHDGTYSSQYMTVSLSYGGAYTTREILRVDYTGIVRPGSDNAYTLGAASYRWSTIYAATGTINTSDAREKTTIASLSEAELAAAKALASEIGTYQFLSAVEEKGADTARLHVGMTVQRAMEIMTAQGLDPTRYGFICHDSWDTETDQDGTVTLEAGDRYSFRPDELLLFIARGFDARLAALEGAA